ncbi:spermatogenesis-associated protein 20 isoform X2 [Dendroctonus ponderosae]|uniref:spermatogenesis-associated protein 20 isoform X2 n=1 Tax=Dendroctonus ponderosae TaxID=77166 RepID=UPI00203632BA|nr:spermatogenesis-associated protein 20 isoform X2 [Dendroctonus ponderosae]
MIRSLSLKSTISSNTMRKMSGAGCSNENNLNRLALEKSPYLLQHATNPVDWYPWGEEAFAKAQSEDKPIFLSVGYSTCHWCHVMEKESFENKDVAEIMNEHFVNIKVDREERPDVDRMYMAFLQATSNNCGWPMSIFLTPTLEPLTGGTYFPLESKGLGIPSFPQLLISMSNKWKTDRKALVSSGKFSLKALEDHAKKGLLSADKSQVAGEDCWHKCALQLSRSYEADFGGFSMAPKFPQPTNFNFLFHLYDKEKDTERGLQCLEMCLHTLKKMAYGGIHDHVNEGFARYSVDERWHVPHFEKMLYDQAQLTVSYCDAYVVTKDEFFADVAKDILSYVSKDLSHELGGFYCAQDADSYPYEGALHKMEGAFCVWEYDEIRNLLDEETNGIKHSDVVIFHYNVKEKGNVSLAQDPHKELKNKNILSCFDSYESTARKFNISIVLLKEILEKSHKVLYEERQKRPKPDTDTKILTSWNGLMISGFAKAGFVLKNQSYINRAILAANFIKKFLYSEEDKFLFRCCYKGDTGQISQTSSPIAGFLDDYAFLIRGLLDLYESSLDADWLQWAETLQETQNALFWDETNAGYFSSSSLDKSILLRSKEDQDGVEPCGNSVSVHNLIRLSTYLHRNDLREKAGETLACFSERLKMFPIALPEMTSALMLYHNFPTQVFIAGPTEDNSTQALLDVVRSRFMPGRILAVADGPGGRAGLLYRRIETLHRLKPIEGRAAAYVCRNFTCSLPVTEPAELATSLDDASNKKIA